MTDAEVESPILCLFDAQSQLIWKDLDAGKDWRWEKGMTEEEMVGCITDLMDMSLSNSGSWWWTGRSGMLQSVGSQSQTRMSDWTESRHLTKPRVSSNSCPSSQWWHPTISFSVIPFSSYLQSFLASGSFPVSWLFALGDQNIGTPASVLSMDI